MYKKIAKLSLLLPLVFIVAPRTANAVIPPDFIFNIGTQIAQFFSIVLIFLSAVIGTLFQFFKTRYYSIKHKKTIIALIVIVTVVISLAVSYLYATYRQNIEYQKWLAESKKYDTTLKVDVDSDDDGLSDVEEATFGTDPNNPDTDGDSYKDGEEIINGFDPNEPAVTNETEQKADENDQLNIGNANNNDVDTSLNKFVANIVAVDASASFISDYYANIANGNLERAYELSKKSVDIDTYKSWYQNTTKITLDNLVRIDEKKSSIELTLYEGAAFIRYGVLMTLRLQGSLPVQVENSDVKILVQGLLENENVLIDENKTTREYDFYNSNESKSIITTNQEFKNITDGLEKNYLVLDARENIEYENGYFPDSLHIRFADLKAGQWIELPKDKFVYVICWSGIRGKEVAEFLRTKKLIASYLENGANGWVEFGGKWVGEIKFGEKYTDARYQIVFDTNEVKKKVERGVVLVDTREPYKYAQSHIPGSVNIPIMYTQTLNLENAFSQVPSGREVITVCDGYVNCFDAKITGVELERRGHAFLGRYNKPWEYGQ